MNDLISRKEAIDAIRASSSKYSKFFMGMEMYTDDDAVEAIEGLPSAQKWTPIDKDWPDKGELPDNFVDVLISIDDAVFMAHRSGDRWYISGGGVEFSNNIDSWMPAPKPYKGEDQ